MKYIHLYTLFLLSVLHAFCGQNQTNTPKDNIKSETKAIVTSHGPNTMVRNIKKGSNGTILIAASFGGFFRYDGKTFTNLTSKIGSSRCWEVLEDQHGNFGSLLLIQVFIITMRNPFNILRPGRDLLIMRSGLFMKIRPALFGSAPEVE